MEIKIYNSLTNKIEPFKSIEPNLIKMYVCGPTVYNDSHVGNVRPLIFFDTITRFFEFIGYKVLSVSNFTDIDDKIINKAQQEGVTALYIANKYIDAYLEIVKKLDCLQAYQYPRVTEYIDKIIKYIEKLVEIDYAYQKGNNVYFRVNKCQKYGILSNQKVEELDIGNRVVSSLDKEDPRDFVLWKLTDDEGHKWESSFGMGRPGWHTECCVMIDEIFKGMIDIHGGGNDLKFPHHENEIAQAMAMNNNVIANYWIHNGRVDLSGEKMSKSLGNVVLAKDILAKYAPQALRLLMLSNNYRQSIMYSDDLMERSTLEWEKIDHSYLTLYRYLELNGEKDFNKKYDESLLMKNFLSEMANDFSTPNAITILYSLMKEVNVGLRQKNLNNLELLKLHADFRDMLFILGLKPTVTSLDETEITLVRNWQEARQNKEFAKADELRNEMNQRGIKI